MTDSVSDTADQIDQLIRKGHSINLLEKIQSVLSSKETSRETKLVYQLLKCRALTSINRHTQALELLDEIRIDIFEIGNDVQILDYYICKAANFAVLSKAKESLALLEEAEQVMQKSQIKNTHEMLQKKIELLIQRMITITATKRYFEFYDPENFDEIIASFDQCITLSHDLIFNYGIGVSLEQKGFYLFYEGRNEEALECYKEALKIWQLDENKGGISRTLAREGMVYAFSGNHSLAIELLEKALVISEELETRRITASIHFNLDVAYNRKGDSKLSLKHSEKACDMFREIGDMTVSAIALQNYAIKVIYGEMEYERGVSILYEALSYAKKAESRRTINNIQTGLSSAFIFKGELNRALNFLDEIIKYYKKNADNEGLSISLSQKGYINLKKGNLDEALKNFQDSLLNHEIRDSSVGFRANFLNSGKIFQMKGDYEQALNNFYEAKKISENLENNLTLASDYSFLISCYLDMEDLEKASSYLKSLQEIDKTIENKVLGIISKLSTALVLKKRENEHARMEAKKLLKFIINEKDVEYQIVETAILNLCDLLLIEFKSSEDNAVIKEIKFFVTKLQEKGIRELTYPLLIQTYWLQSQISLLELNTEEAQLLYTKAQAIAEEKELEYMAMKISAEHDFLIGQLDLWKQFTTKLPSILEILELTKIEDMLNQMLRKCVILPSDVEHGEENPSLIFILTESGEILFTEKITKTFEDELISRILPEIRTRIDEESDFENIKRGRLYDYSYLMKQVDSLFFCYFFVGKSYQAIKKLEEFSRILNEASGIWNQLITSSRTDLALNFEERRSITSFIDEIFLPSK